MTVFITLEKNCLLAGNVGMVKDATDTTARVELHSSCQTISVDVSHIAAAGEQRRVRFVVFVSYETYFGMMQSELLWNRF